MSKTEEQLQAEKEAAAKKAAEDQRKKEEEEKRQKEEEEKEVDPKIKEILDGGPDSVNSLLEAKRKANAEAKEYRLKLEKLESEKAEAEKKRLADEGKFKELAEKEKARADSMEVKTKKLFIDRALEKAALAAKIFDLDTVALADRSKVTIDADFEVSGAEDAIEDLKSRKPHLFLKGDEDEDDNGGRRTSPTQDDVRPGLRTEKTKVPEGISPHSRVSAVFNKKSKK